MKFKNILLFLIAFALLISCAPYKMKAIRAKRDNNYKLALKYSLKHLKGNENDKSVIKLLEQSSKEYFEDTKQKIAHYQKIEQWEKVMTIANQTHQYLSEVMSVVGVEFPTKQELAYLESVTERTYSKKAEQLYESGLKAFEKEKFEQALNDFLECKENMNHFKDVDEFIYKTKRKLAEQQYAEAIKLIQQKKFEQALEKFEKVNEYVPNFMNVNEQLNNTKYQLAEKYFQESEKFNLQGDYKSAYDAMNKVITYNSDYPEAQQKFEALQNKLIVRLAIFSFETKRLDKKFGDIVSQRITSALHSKRSNFLQLLDRQNLQKIFEEQALSQSGVIDESTAVQVGKMSGVNSIVVGDVTLVSYVDTKPMRSVKTANYDQNYRDERKIQRTKKIPFNYTKFEKKRSVEINLNYRVVSVETGAIVLSNSLNKIKSDTAEWIVCDKQRVKDLPSQEKRLVGASKNTKSIENLINEAISELSRDAANNLISKLVNGG